VKIGEGKVIKMVHLTKSWGFQRRNSERLKSAISYMQIVIVCSLYLISVKNLSTYDTMAFYWALLKK